VPPPLPGDQAEGLVAVGLAQARDGDQPPGVPHLLHKVLGGCSEHVGGFRPAPRLGSSELVPEPVRCSIMQVWCVCKGIWDTVCVGLQLPVT